MAFDFPNVSHKDTFDNKTQMHKHIHRTMQRAIDRLLAADTTLEDLKANVDKLKQNQTFEYMDTKTAYRDVSESNDAPIRTESYEEDVQVTHTASMANCLLEGFDNFGKFTPNSDLNYNQFEKLLFVIQTAFPNDFKTQLKYANACLERNNDLENNSDVKALLKPIQDEVNNINLAANTQNTINKQQTEQVKKFAMACAASGTNKRPHRVLNNPGGTTSKLSVYYSKDDPVAKLSQELAVSPPSAIVYNDSAGYLRYNTNPLVGDYKTEIDEINEWIKTCHKHLKEKPHSKSQVSLINNLAKASGIALTEIVYKSKAEKIQESASRRVASAKATISDATDRARDNALARAPKPIQNYFQAKRQQSEAKKNLKSATVSFTGQQQDAPSQSKGKENKKLR